MINKKETENIESVDLNLLEAMELFSNKSNFHNNSLNISDKDTEQTMKIFNVNFDETMGSLIKTAKENRDISDEKSKENTDTSEQEVKEKIDTSKENTTQKKERKYNAKHFAQVFSSFLNTETLEQQNKNHFWIMAVDDDFRVKLTYTVSFEFENKGELLPTEILRFAVLNECKKIIIASNYTGIEKFVKPTDEDIDFTNMLYHMCERLGIELIDNIIITQ